MTSMLALLLAYFGLAMLAMAMDRHQRQVHGRTLPRLANRKHRALGILGMGASLATCVAQDGWGIGSVLWFGMMSLAGLAVVVFMAYAPQRIWLFVPTGKRKPRSS